MENQPIANVEPKKREYKEERFEFALFVNDNVICKRNFRIFNYIEHSMETLDFKETIDRAVRLIDDDLKSKSRVYTWYYYNPLTDDGNEHSEFMQPLIDPWVCTFKLAVYDNKHEVISKVWDGYAYPRAIRERVDLGNKYVKITDKDGNTYTYEKDKFFDAKGNRLSFDQEVLKAMIIDKQDVLLQITKMICEACSYGREESMGRSISDYVVNEEYRNDDKSVPSKNYSYSLALANKKIENKWAKATAEKTREYLKSSY